MRTRVIGIVLVALFAFASTAWAETSEEKVAVRRAAEWAAGVVERDLPAAVLSEGHNLDRLALVVGPPGDLVGLLRAPVSTALGRVEGITEALATDKEVVTGFVDDVYVDPDDPRWNKETALKLTGAFESAKGLLSVDYVVGEDPQGGARVDVTLSLRDGQSGEKIWGARHTETVDLTLLAEIRGFVEAGRIDEALAKIGPVLAKHPEWETDLELLRKRAETLRAHTETLARIRGFVEMGEDEKAFAAIRSLYAEGDPALHDALSDLLADVRAKLVMPVEVWIDAGDLDRAQARATELEEEYVADSDLVRLLGYQRRRIRAIERAAEAAAAAVIRQEREATAAAEKAEREAAAAAAKAEREREGAKADEARKEGLLYYVIGGLLAAILLAFVLRVSLRKRRHVGRRNLGIDELDSEAAQADRVREILQKDVDLRARVLRELDRAEDALAEAHHKAQEAGRSAVAKGLHEASQQLQELRRRAKLTQNGDPQDFLKGRLPKKNLEGLVSWLPAVAGQTEELTKEAMAAHDSVVAGGDPAKNLKLMGGLSLRIQGKLAEREAFFRTMA